MDYFELNGTSTHRESSLPASNFEKKIINFPFVKRTYVYKGNL